MANRIDTTFENARRAGRSVLAPFVTIGYPDVDSSEEIAAALLDSGGDMLELGVPFSDPLADGATVQRSSAQALRNGVDVPACLDAVRRLRDRGISSPLVLMGYFNPFMRYGQQRFAADAARAGADGLIVPDLPLDDGAGFARLCADNGLHLVPMLAPTSTDRRIELACKGAGGFIYCVSLTGVTGARPGLRYEAAARLVERIRRHTDVPTVVGFGVSSPRHLEEIAGFADGAIVASALLDAIGDAPAGKAVEAAREFLTRLKGRRKPPGEPGARE